MQTYHWYKKVGNDYICECDIEGKPIVYLHNIIRYVNNEDGSTKRDENGKLVFEEGMYVQIPIPGISDRTEQGRNLRLKFLQQYIDKKYKIYEGTICEKYIVSNGRGFLFIDFHNDIINEHWFFPEFERYFYSEIHKDFLNILNFGNNDR